MTSSVLAPLDVSIVPAALTAEAAALWHRVGARLVEDGVLLEPHRMAFMVWCAFAARMQAQRQPGATSIMSKEFSAWCDMMLIPDDVRRELLS